MERSRLVIVTGVIALVSIFAFVNVPAQHSCADADDYIGPWALLNDSEVSLSNPDVFNDNAYGRGEFPQVFEILSITSGTFEGIYNGYPVAGSFDDGRLSFEFISDQQGLYIRAFGEVSGDLILLTEVFFSDSHFSSITSAKYSTLTRVVYDHIVPSLPSYGLLDTTKPLTTKGALVQYYPDASADFKIVPVQLDFVSSSGYLAIAKLILPQCESQAVINCVVSLNESDGPLVYNIYGVSYGVTYEGTVVLSDGQLYLDLTITGGALKQSLSANFDPYPIP